MLSPLSQDKPTVLVVDDSPEIRRYFRRLLELDSYHVETACDGGEALDRLRAGLQPQIVLLDIQMPGIDGLTTLRYMRKLHPSLKVIMCSGEEDLSKMRKAEVLGAQAYLAKPVQHLYLSAALQRCLGADAPLPDSSSGSLVMFPESAYCVMGAKPN
jgi:CheY-like chemotaxis protein